MSPQDDNEDDIVILNDKTIRYLSKDIQTLIKKKPQDMSFPMMNVKQELETFLKMLYRPQTLKTST